MIVGNGEDERRGAGGKQFIERAVKTMRPELLPRIASPG